DRAERRLAPDDTVLAVMFKKRWNDVTGLQGTAFALTLDEQRALLRFLIAHPAVTFSPLSNGAAPESPAMSAARRRVIADEKRLEKVRELASVDPEYPAAYAEGVLLYRLGRFEASGIAFDRHLSAQPEGPLTLRARNHLKAALEAR